MARYSGIVTYVTQAETVPGVWTDSVNGHLMRGDVLRMGSSNQNGDKVHSDVTLSHRVSLVADEYALGNYHDIKYIQFNGRDWTVTSIEVQHPRIIVTLGGLWNGN